MMVIHLPLRQSTYSMRSFVWGFLLARDCSNSNIYRTIMIDHSFAKLYATILDTMFSNHLEHGNHNAQGQDGFRRDFQTINHIFTSSYH